MDFLFNLIIEQFVIFISEGAIIYMDTITVILKLIFSQPFLLAAFFLTLNKTALNQKSELYYAKINSFMDFAKALASYKKNITKAGKVLAFIIFWLFFSVAFLKIILELEPYQNNWVALFNINLFRSVISIFCTFLLFLLLLKSTFYLYWGK